MMPSQKPAAENIPASDVTRHVFINCPFDQEYRPLFDAIVFTVLDCGFSPRCALEIDDGSEVRIEKIFRLIGECRYGIHDLSRTELDGAHGLPRFNMPFELGIFLGAKRYGNTEQRKKSCLVLDIEPYRFQKFISDIAGQDPRAHGGCVGNAITAIRNWLRAASRRTTIPGGEHIATRYSRFRDSLPALCRQLKVTPAELTFPDYRNIAATWLDEWAPLLE